MNDVSFQGPFLPQGAQSTRHITRVSSLTRPEKDMLARANKIKQSKGAAADNVSFVKGVITNIPLEAGIADCIISNCVINLVPAAEKPLVFAEMYRLLKPGGGRVAVSDILAKKELPEKLKNDLAMYVGCIAGASKVAEYETWLKEAGFNGMRPIILDGCVARKLYSTEMTVLTTLVSIRYSHRRHARGSQRLPGYRRGRHEEDGVLRPVPRPASHRFDSRWRLLPSVRPSTRSQDGSDGRLLRRHGASYVLLLGGLCRAADVDPGEN